jgi:Lrp/AsnC family transcriptional regulator, regulator for asnA, asnC and gidA
VSGDASVDEVDRGIVAELHEDGRRPFREIARNLGVDERTVRTRVRRMQDAGHLRFIAFIDPRQISPSVLAMVLLRVDAEAHDRIVETLVSWPEVAYISTLMGRADIYLQLVCQNNEDLWQLVSKRLRGLDGVLETETMTEMAIHKFRYDYPRIGRKG